MNHPYRFLLIIGILILAVISFMMWQNRKTIDDPEDTQVPTDDFSEIKFIMDEMEAQTGLDFSSPIPTTFTWNVREDMLINEETLNGYVTKATGAAEVDARAVEDFFINALFNLDVYNVSTGTVSAQSGYLDDDLACVVKTQSIADELGNIVENSTDIEVYCGYTHNVANSDSTTLANPASVYCEDKGYKIMSVETQEGTVSYCYLSRNQICEEWAYFRSEGQECVNLNDTYVFDSAEACQQSCQSVDFFNGRCEVEGEQETGAFSIAECEDGGSDFCYCEYQEDEDSLAESLN